jgi:hypothetical protein
MGKMNGVPLTVALAVITCLVSVVVWLSGMTCGVSTLSTAIREATAALQLTMDQTAKDFRTHERIPGHPQVIERVDALGEDVQDIRAGIGAWINELLTAIQADPGGLLGLVIVFILGLLGG